MVIRGVFRLLLVKLSPGCEDSHTAWQLFWQQFLHEEGLKVILKI